MLPYRTRFPWFLQTLVFTGAGIVLYLIFFETNTIIQLWSESNWLFRLMMLFTLVASLGGSTEGLFQRTTLTQTSITHRTRFLRTIKKTYADISHLEFKQGKYLDVYFVDGKKIKIWAATAQLPKVIRIIKGQTGKRLPVENT